MFKYIIVISHPQQSKYNRYYEALYFIVTIIFIIQRVYYKLLAAIYPLNFQCSFYIIRYINKIINTVNKYLIKGIFF